MVIIGLIVGVLGCIMPIAIIVLIVSAITKKNKEDKNNFEETIRNIYTYIILIVTLVAIISGIIATFRIGLDVILPERTINESSYSDEQMERNENIIEFCTTLSLVVSVIPVFIYHNNLAKKSRCQIKMEE